MNREDVLREKTHKTDGIETGMRVFNTICPSPGPEFIKDPLLAAKAVAAVQALAVVRTGKALSLLIEHLEKTGQLSANEIDELLLLAVA